MSDVANVAKRLKALYTAVAYDIMDEMDMDGVRKYAVPGFGIFQ